MLILSFPALLNRFQVVRFPPVKTTLPVVAILTFVSCLISALLENPPIQSFVTKLLLLLPTLHILSMRPGDDSKSRFHGEVEQVATGLSTTQMAKMTKVTQTSPWEFVRPHVESIATNICEFSDNFSDIKVYTQKSRETPHVHTMAQDHARNINLANLKKRDKNFQEKAFLNRVRSAFAAVQNASYNHKVEIIQRFVSDALYEQFKCRVEEQQTAGIQYQHGDLSTADFSIDHVYSDNNFDEIQVLVQASIAESITDLKTGKTIGSATTRKFYEYWSFIRRPSAKTLQKPGLLEGSCPNCGAPLLIGQVTICKACGSYIRSGFYDWVLAKITQGCEWSYSDPTLVPSWKNLKAADPEFTIYQIEDLAGVVFWNLRLAERSRSVEPIFRFANSILAEILGTSFKKRKDSGYTYWENIAIASVSLKGIAMENEQTTLYVLVVWSGIPVTANADGSVSERIRYCKPVRDILVLNREARHKTNQNNILSSAHCRSCGGTLASSFSTNCGYCGSTLNDGKEWQLARLLKENDPESAEILTRKAAMVSERFAENMAAESAKTKKEVKTQEIRSGRDIITTMVQVLLADGVIDEAEIKFVNEMAKKYHMPPETLEGLIESVKEGTYYFPAPQTRMEALEIVKGAVRMAYADGVLAPEEMAALESVAKLLGYSALDLKQIIKAEEKLLRRASKSFGAK
ncbi:MAG: TIM44-like domain-containing protein [Candidatus Riflebacteria bacterium]|nr:TIM44-like domain-containing protein [Candidatus Riflebacteria bacterium]